MQDRAVEHDIDRFRSEVQSPSVTGECLVGLSGRESRADAIGIRINGDEPIVRSREEMPARVPAAANRKHNPPLQTQAVGQQLALALEQILIVGLESRLLAEGIE